MSDAVPNLPDGGRSREGDRRATHLHAARPRGHRLPPLVPARPPPRRRGGRPPPPKRCLVRRGGARRPAVRHRRGPTPRPRGAPPRAEGALRLGLAGGRQRGGALPPPPRQRGVRAPPRRRDGSGPGRAVSRGSPQVSSTIYTWPSQYATLDPRTTPTERKQHDHYSGEEMAEDPGGVGGGRGPGLVDDRAGGGRTSLRPDPHGATPSAGATPDQPPHPH